MTAHFEFQMFYDLCSNKTLKSVKIIIIIIIIIIIQYHKNNVVTQQHTDMMMIGVTIIDCKNHIQTSFDDGADNDFDDNDDVMVLLLPPLLHWNVVTSLLPMT